MAIPNRIEINPKILAGKPVIRGTRIPVYIILQMIRDGASFEEIIKGYPRLSQSDISAAIDYTLHLLHMDDTEEILMQEG